MLHAVTDLWISALQGIAIFMLRKLILEQISDRGLDADVQKRRGTHIALNLIPILPLCNPYKIPIYPLNYPLFRHVYQSWRCLACASRGEEHVA